MGLCKVLMLVLAATAAVHADIGKVEPAEGMVRRRPSGVTVGASGVVEIGNAAAADSELVGLNVNLAKSDMLSAQDLSAHEGTSSMLVLTPLIHDRDATWGKNGSYPSWIVNLFGATARHARRHNHSHVVRTALHDVKSSAHALQEGSLRDQAGWEKIRMLHDFLGTGKYSHVLALDADVAFVHPGRDTVREMAKQMDERSAAVLVADQDWAGPKGQGSGSLSTGVMMVRNTLYAKKLLSAMLKAHDDPKGTGWTRCGGTDQECLRAFFQDTRKTMRFAPDAADAASGSNRLGHAFIASGHKYNRHPEVPCTLSFKEDTSCSMNDVDIVHFSNGAGKSTRTEVIWNSMLTYTD